MTIQVSFLCSVQRYACNLRLLCVFRFIFVKAPGAYSPEKINLDKGPRYSLAGKGPAEKSNDNPGKVISTLAKELFISNIQLV